MTSVRDFLCFHLYTKLPWSMTKGRFGLWILPFAGRWAHPAPPSSGEAG